MMENEDPSIMDPLEILPTEMLEYIWSMLDKKALLSCLRVNHSWRELTQNVNSWRRYCDGKVSNLGSSWYEIFLKESKLKWPWIVGSFNDGFVIDDCKLFTCNGEYVFVADCNSRLLKYHPSGRLVKAVDVPEDSKKIYIIEDDIGLLCERLSYFEIVIFDEDLEELFRFESTVNAPFCSGGRLWFRSMDNGYLVTVYYGKTEISDRRLEHLEVPIGSTLTPITSGWSLLYEGVVTIILGEHQEKIYKCDGTPMSRIFMTIFSNNLDIIVVIDKKIIAEKHVYCTIIIYRNGTKLFRADIPKQLRYWCFSGTFLVLASFKDVSSINLTDGQVVIGQELIGLEYTDYIYGIHNLFHYPHIAYVIVDHCAYFSIYDVKNQNEIIKINCARTPNMIATSLTTTLICVPKLFVYCLQEQNKIEVKTIKL